MKHINRFALLLLTFLISFAAFTLIHTNIVNAATDDVAINESNFPDERFRTFISDSFDTDSNGYLSPEEIKCVEEITYFDRNSGEVEDFTGIEYFYSLKKLNLFNEVTMSLDLRSCTQLEVLSCRNSDFDFINLSGLKSLKSVDCSTMTNDLTKIDLSGCTGLEYLDCSSDYYLKALDLCDCKNIKELICDFSGITTIDLKECPNLEIFSCNNCKFKNLDFSTVNSIREIYCNDNEMLTIDLSGCTSLEN